MASDSDLCAYCFGPLPEGCQPHRKYCSDRCRRDMQNERRRDERAEMREVRDIEKYMPMNDPYSMQRNDLADLTVEEIEAINYTLDAAPDMYEARWEKVDQMMQRVKSLPSEKKNKNWLYLTTWGMC